MRTSATTDVREGAGSEGLAEDLGGATVDGPAQGDVVESAEESAVGAAAFDREELIGGDQDRFQLRKRAALL